MQVFKYLFKVNYVLKNLISLYTKNYFTTQKTKRKVQLNFFYEITVSFDFVDNLKDLISSYLIKLRL